MMLISMGIQKTTLTGNFFLTNLITYRVRKKLQHEFQTI